MQKQQHQSNKFNWCQYEVPVCPHYDDETPPAAAAADDAAGGEHAVLKENEEGRHPTSRDVSVPSSASSAAADDDDDDDGNDTKQPLSFTIRYLKQGATGAVKTWPVAEILLEYLVKREGLFHTRNKVRSSDDNDNSCSGRSNGEEGDPVEACGEEDGILDLTRPPSPPLSPPPLRRINDPSSAADEISSSSSSSSSPSSEDWCNVVELGAGAGYLGIGLALALNHPHRSASSSHSTVTTKRERKRGGNCVVRPTPRVRVLCTDHDKATVKNCRHNVSSQPKGWNVSKAVRVDSLDWGDDIGGDKFAKTIKSHFRRQVGGATGDDDDAAVGDDDDPLRRVTHLIGSDLHYGVTTLGPLSSVVSAFKLRHPAIKVILLLKERPGHLHVAVADVAELKRHIETKVRDGLQEAGCLEKDANTAALREFSVRVRNVVHKDVSNVKLLEC